MEMTDKNIKKERFLAQKARAIEMLQAERLADYLDGLRYAYSFCLRYKKNLRDLVDLYKLASLQKCIKCGILREYNDTYWLNKEKLESLYQYILEQ